MHFPQWVDLKGQDSVPETVHHVVCKIDAKTDRMWIRLKPQERVEVCYDNMIILCEAYSGYFILHLIFINFPFQTDGIHANDEIRPGSDYPETLSEGTKILKGEYVLKVYFV